MRKRSAPEPTINCTTAGKLMQRSPQIVWHWARLRRIPTVSRRPFRFRVADILDAIATAPPPRPARRTGAWGRPRPSTTELQSLANEILEGKGKGL